MSLLQKSDVPTKEQKLTLVANRIKAMSLDTFTNLVRTQKDGINVLWNNSNFTPQEIIDALGEDAIKVFQFHGELTDLIVNIATVDGVTVELDKPNNAFTVDAQGKITVTDKPYA